MDRVFANFQIDNDFYVLLFLFLLITMIITTLIVIFLIKIQTLSSILEQAKEIDRAKEKYLSSLKIEFDENIFENIKLQEKLNYLKDFKEQFRRSNTTVSILQEQIINQEKEHVDEVHAQRAVLDKLRIHHKILIEQLEKAEEEVFIVKKSYEDLKENNSILYTRNRELEIKIYEQKKQTIEKMQMMEEHRGELKDEFTELASKIFDGQPKNVTKFRHKNLNIINR